MNKHLTKFIAVAAIALAPFIGLSTAQGADTVLRAATDTGFPPFEFRDDKTGEYVGFDMDMLREISERAGFEYELNAMAFPGIIPGIQAHQIDIAVAAIDITEKRKEIVDFSIPYYHHGMRIMVLKDNDSIQELEDLNGKKVSTKIGSSDYDYLVENLPEAEIVPFPETADMYLAVISGEVDAAFYDEPNMAYFTTQKQGEKVKLVGPSYNPINNGFVFPKGSEWVEKVDDAIQSIIDDGTYNKIHAKWFGDEPSEEIIKNIGR